MRTHQRSTEDPDLARGFSLGFWLREDDLAVGNTLASFHKIGQCKKEWLLKLFDSSVLFLKPLAALRYDSFS